MKKILEKSGWRIEFLEEIDSTNQEAIRRAEQGEASGLVLVADFQTRGRGRLGRTWSAKPKNSLLASVLLRPAIASEHLGLIPILSGVALALSIEEIAGFKPGLIWPNDLFGKKGKMAGILVESALEKGQLKFVVIGAGVNLAQTKEDFPLEIRPRASSISEESGKIVSRDRILFVYLDHLGFWLKSLEKGEFSRIVEKYSEFDIIKGSQVRVLTGGDEMTGIASGIDLQGRLKLQSRGKKLSFSAGEITRIRGIKDAVSD